MVREADEASDFVVVCPSGRQAFALNCTCALDSQMALSDAMTPSTRWTNRWWFHAGLLALTCLTTFGTFYLLFGAGSRAEAAANAAMFSSAIIVILGSHEMGHYVLARKHGVDVTLPYFIPAPLLGMGTLGAVIRIRGRIPHRNALVDIGAAGPLAGLAAAVPVLVVGLAFSRVGDSPVTPGQFPAEGSLWALAGHLVRWLAGQGGPAVDAGQMRSLVFGDNLLMLGLQRLVLGPLPPGKDVFVHPLVIAGWFGLLVTMLNLLPIGQTDGGHLTFAVFGKRAERIGRGVAAGIFAMCMLYSAGWLVWFLVTTRVIGYRHPPVVVPEVALTRGRLVLCVLCGVALVVCLMPIPLSNVAVP
jgi:membrane-associated protease RseP (regulator of RpoE activity)